MDCDLFFLPCFHLESFLSHSIFLLFVFFSRLCKSLCLQQCEPDKKLKAEQFIILYRVKYGRAALPFHLNHINTDFLLRVKWQCQYYSLGLSSNCIFSLSLVNSCIVVHFCYRCFKINVWIRFFYNCWCYFEHSSTIPIFPAWLPHVVLTWLEIIR